MMNYLIIANIYLVLFYGFYRFFLSRETFFQLNRIYLMGTTGLAFVLPLIQLEWLQNAFGASTVYAARSSLDAVTLEIVPKVDVMGADNGIQLPVWFYLYMGGVLVQLMLLLRKSIYLRNRLRTNRKGDAYSFMRTIKVDVTQEESAKVIDHEQVHVRQLHSFDVLLVELVKLFNWFNPIVYYLSNSLRLTHEYIADEAINRNHMEKVAYAELLISRTFSVSSNVLTNNFLNQSFIKNRIMMLFKDKSKRSALLKYALAMPLFIGMLLFSSAKVSDKAERLTEETIVSSTLAKAIYQDSLAKRTKGDVGMQITVNPTNGRSNVTVQRDAQQEKVVDYARVEVAPNFPNGGMRAFYKWIGDNYKYPEEAKKNEVSGVLHLSFIVERDGSLSDIELLKDLGYGTGEAAIALLKTSPKWLPGIVDRKPVRVAYSLPIQLNLKGTDDEKNKEKNK